MNFNSIPYIKMCRRRCRSRSTRFLLLLRLAFLFMSVVVWLGRIAHQTNWWRKRQHKRAIIDSVCTHICELRILARNRVHLHWHCAQLRICQIWTSVAAKHPPSQPIWNFWIFHFGEYFPIDVYFCFHLTASSFGWSGILFGRSEYFRGTSGVWMASFFLFSSICVSIQSISALLMQ